MDFSSEGRGLFITLEGGEGTGKTTQISLLAGFLRDRGYDVVTTREPGGTPEAEKIRELLVHRDGGDWTPMAECLLFFTARHMHVETLIKPALAAGKVVISDRFTDSTRAYQSYGHNVLPLDAIESVRQISIGDFEPDLTFILDIDVKTGLKRAGKRLDEDGSGEDRFEKLDLSFHERLRKGYLDIAARHDGRCRVINAGRPVEDIAQEMREMTMQQMENRKAAYV